jgi:hypothetical protein
VVQVANEPLPVASEPARAAANASADEPAQVAEVAAPAEAAAAAVVLDTAPDASSDMVAAVTVPADQVVEVTEAAADSMTQSEPEAESAPEPQVENPVPTTGGLFDAVVPVAQEAAAPATAEPDAVSHDTVDEETPPRQAS